MRLTPDYVALALPLGAKSALQELTRVNAKGRGEFAHHCDRCTIGAGLKLADVAPINLCPKSELLLGPALLSSEPPEVPGNNVPQVVHHGTNATC
jgi:hypothetical protein